MSTVLAYLYAFLIGMCCVVMLAWIIIAARHGDYIESFFPTSIAVLNIKSLYAQAGTFGKVMRVLGIAVALTFRNVCPTKALLDKAECLAFPVRWRRLLVGLFIVHASVVTLLVLIYQLVGV
jgi:hypothetical protein